MLFYGRSDPALSGREPEAGGGGDDDERGPHHAACAACAHERRDASQVRALQRDADDADD